jgi:hypothetical protein
VYFSANAIDDGDDEDSTDDDDDTDEPSAAAGKSFPDLGSYSGYWFNLCWSNIHCIMR